VRPSGGEFARRVVIRIFGLIQIVIALRIVFLLVNAREGNSIVKGILDLPLVTLKSASPILSNPFNRNKATALSLKQFHYAFTNTLSEEESQAVYQRYAVPAVNRVLFQGAFANLSPKSPMKVDFANDDRAPLLLIGGGDDHVVPAKVNKKNAEKYGKSKAITEFKEFPGRSHYTLGQPGWEEVADYALEWAVAHASAPVPA